MDIVELSFPQITPTMDAVGCMMDWSKRDAYGYKEKFGVKRKISV